MTSFRSYPVWSALRAPLAILFLAALVAAPAAAQSQAWALADPTGPLPCPQKPPPPPDDPSSDQDYGCYYFATYTWNDGSGAGNVTGRITWPSICGDGTNDPPGSTPLPTVLLMHGDGHHYNDYRYLMRHLALNGFIAASIENGGTNLTRTAQARTFLNFMTNHWAKRDWVDPQNLGLIGHSRGGEAVLTLARRIEQLNLPYHVNAIVSIAPTDNDEGGAGFHESLVGSSSQAFLVIYGTHDEDVTGYCLDGGLPECGAPLTGPRQTGFSLYDRAGSEFSTEPPTFLDAVVDKCLLFIRGASHNGWRETCSGFPPPGVLTCTTHWEMAKGYLNAFLRWQLRDQEIYRYYFTGGYVLPEVAERHVKVQRSYQEGFDRRVVDNFESAQWWTNTLGGSVMMETSTLTMERYGSTWDYEPTSPHDTNSMVVSWAPPGLAPWMAWFIPDGQTPFGRRWRDVEMFEYLSVRAGQVHGSGYNDPDLSKDFYVQLRDSSGSESPWVRVSDYADLTYPVEAQVFKFGQPLMVASSAMQTLRIPMCRFTGIDLENVNLIRFYFTVPGSSTGELILDNLEFTH